MRCLNEPEKDTGGCTVKITSAPGPKFELNYMGMTENKPGNGPGQELDNRRDHNMDAEMGTVEEGDRRN